MNIKLAKEHCLGEQEMRHVYARELVTLIEGGEPILVTDADLMRAIGVLPYLEKYPDSIFDCGIMEANMIGVACGLSAEGFVPFTHSFGTFASRRVMDQVYMSGAYAKRNVKMVGSDPGVCAGLNGGTHMALEDVAMMRAVPEMTIIEPTDSAMLKNLIPKIAHSYGMTYIRLCREKTENIYEDGSDFDIGRAATIRDGKDVTIIAAGREVIEAVNAAEELSAHGIEARVIDMFTIKPLDKDAVIRAARETGAIVSAENHNIIGGLGSAVAEALAASCPVPMEFVGTKDRFGEVGLPPVLKERFGLTAKDIVEAAEKVIARKRR